MGRRHHRCSTDGLAAFPEGVQVPFGRLSLKAGMRLEEHFLHRAVVVCCTVGRVT